MCPTMVNCIDNSGAAIVECVKVLRMKRHAKVGTQRLLFSPHQQQQRSTLHAFPSASPPASPKAAPAQPRPYSLPLAPPSHTQANAPNPTTGDRIIVVVQKQRSFGPESGPGGSVSISAANKVRRGDIRHAVVVRTAKKTQRPDGSVVKFDDNACVLINKGGEPIGSRLNGES
ncbi:hypothetical protein LTR04_005778 [Oleoguttula sp. CCFEE 6159]|nr:hypothetical protein LTR04_005778 [Oleoguttula sp. CCFEE 6159]